MGRVPAVAGRGVRLRGARQRDRLVARRFARACLLPRQDAARSRRAPERRRLATLSQNSHTALVVFPREASKRATSVSRANYDERARARDVGERPFPARRSCVPHGGNRAFRAQWVDATRFRPAKVYLNFLEEEEEEGEPALARCRDFDRRHVVSCGPALRGGRELSLVDARSPAQPLFRKTVDTATGALVPRDPRASPFSTRPSLSFSRDGERLFSPLGVA